MAHLIKLEDYISRYQFDLHRYPSQYSRMKKERWYYVKSDWEQFQLDSVNGDTKEYQYDEVLEEERGLLAQTFERIKRWTKRNRDQVEIVDMNDHSRSIADERMKNMTLEQLKQSFLDDLFYSQLRWASSSLVEESSIDPRYKRDTWLRFFAQKVPDNYFLMYKPVFFIKKAPIELDIILISPTEIICVTIIEGQEHSVFEASSDRFWTEYIDETRKKRISPLLSLSRMTGVIREIIDDAELSFPIRKVVLCPTSIIDNKMQGANVELVDRRTFDSWQTRIIKHPSPLKHQQMKVTAALLEHCHTVSYQFEDSQIADEESEQESLEKNESQGLK
ncbi:NERD domain-containing protein [Halalkalibacter nanhaiisediminis]|uniref:Nuclease-like protein n=1 Tax=Halalkalibacter nanhaiisediminis TaxID=688079 RepID=A0A562QJK7_9BACI|nr:NERD domain-containing protein [Halalkalibacter nanhaiisediminis]TWI56914.1 hypothetical protein IQ10_01606 [Halalkalibacter nanhaiisediminis]